jgi:hypothetical protein
MDTIRKIAGGACRDLAGFIARQLLVIGVLYFGTRYAWRRMTRIATEPARTFRATYEEARRELAEPGRKPAADTRVRS